MGKSSPADGGAEPPAAFSAEVAMFNADKAREALKALNLRSMNDGTRQALSCVSHGCDAFELRESHERRGRALRRHELRELRAR